MFCLVFVTLAGKERFTLGSAQTQQQSPKGILVLTRALCIVTLGDYLCIWAEPKFYLFYGV